MKTSRAIAAIALSALASVAAAADGLVALKSPYDARITMDRLEGLVKQRGLNVFARIDHAAGAAKVDMALRPTELLIFGHPKGGTPFMQCAQTIGIDLPLKALVWQDASGQVWLGYNDPGYISERHGAQDCTAAANIGKGLASLAQAAVAR